MVWIELFLHMRALRLSAGAWPSNALHVKRRRQGGAARVPKISGKQKQRKREEGRIGCCASLSHMYLPASLPLLYFSSFFFMYCMWRVLSVVAVLLLFALRLCVCCWPAGLLACLPSHAACSLGHPDSLVCVSEFEWRAAALLCILSLLICFVPDAFLFLFLLILFFVR